MKCVVKMENVFTCGRLMAFLAIQYFFLISNPPVTSKVFCKVMVSGGMLKGGTLIRECNTEKNVKGDK